jgi:cell division protein FtsB
MLHVKKMIMPFLLFSEIAIFVIFYAMGSNGLQAILRLQKENNSLSQDIDRLSFETSQLEFEIKEWNTYPWYKEQVARQDLQLGYSNEELFLL